jgi:hypothetical protein
MGGYPPGVWGILCVSLFVCVRYGKYSAVKY